MDNHVGAALQVGFDYVLNEHWGADNATLGRLSGKAKLDPWLVGTGVTYRF